MAEPKSEGVDQADYAKACAAKLSEPAQRKQGITMYFDQMFALLLKRLIMYRRKWSWTLTIFFIPLFLIVGLTYSFSRGGKINELEMDPADLRSTLVFMQYGGSSLQVKNFSSVLHKEGFVLKAVDAKENLSEIIVQRSKIFPPISFSFSFNANGEVNALFNGNLRHGAPLALLLVDLSRIYALNGSISLSFHPYGEASKFSSSEGPFSMYSSSHIVLIVLTSGLPMFLVDERRCNFMHQGLNDLSDKSLESSEKVLFQRLYNNFISLFVSLIFYSVILCVSQSRLTTSYIMSLWNKIYCRKPVIERIDDVDVVAEHNRLLVGRNDLALCVNEVNKFYGKLHAVKDLSFGINADECFGLLGANGAGKTSTFDLIVGYSYRSSGNVFINGVSVDSKQVIGHCPQFDALLEHLTGKETLLLIASLCGFRDVKTRVFNVLEAVSLLSEADKYVKQYSGGQKRRLSIGVALICQAKLTLLDEPTAGVDPKARRQIWDLLSSLRGQGFAILLTSHNMEECEALCTRIGIMHQGSLVAIGSPQYIKSKFGDGYTLILFMKKDTEKSFMAKYVQSTFPNAISKDFHHPMQSVWHIPKTPNDRWSDLFAKASNLVAKSDLIVDFSLAQATLVEAFMRLSNLGGEDRINLAPNLPLSTLV